LPSRTQSSSPSIIRQANEKRNRKTCRAFQSFPTAFTYAPRNSGAGSGECAAKDCEQVVESPSFLWKASENRSATRLRESSSRFICVDPRNQGQKKCGPGQPPEPHSFVDSCAALSPLGGGMTASARQRSRSRSHELKNDQCRIRQSRLRIRHLAVTYRQPLRGQRPFIAPRSSLGEGAATPGQPVAPARVLWISPGNSPSRITGCRWLCRNHSASSGTFTFRCHHFQTNPAASQPEKAAPL
jgi:hypothetical protein